MCEAKASSRPLNELDTLPHDGRKFCQFDVAAFGQYFAVAVPGVTEPFGHLDRGVCSILRKLSSFPDVFHNATIEWDKLKQLRAKSNPTKQVSLSINICGPVDIADRVGATLSEVSAFLQHPFFLDRRYRYFNPQIFRAGSEMEDLTHLVGLTELDMKARALSDEVDGVLQSLGGDESYPDRYSIPIADILSDNLNTKLME